MRPSTARVWLRAGLTCLLLGLCVALPWPGVTAENRRATLVIHAEQKSPHSIPRFLTGKFTEHLGNNVYNGLDAQILRNPTFADYPFATGQTTPDGIATFLHERERIDREIRRQATRYGWPESELGSLVDAYHDGLACGWSRIGSPDCVKVSPDTAAGGQRAQRLEIAPRGEAQGLGVAQYVYLPLHRVRRFEVEVFGRSPDLKRLRISLRPSNQATEPAELTLSGLSSDWRTLSGTLAISPDAPPSVPYLLSILADAPGNVVLARVQLRPVDHMQGADPDVIRLLRESQLPLMRWPGGNFVSGYHWEDGVGPLDLRPTRPNPAWGGVEPNFFGTAEFIAWCRAIGCEPMICVNAGDGTPEEAARWIQYCNGSSRTPMGRLRAAHGHPKPFRVKHWEVGNELWGRWQVNWTTATGYVDRFRQFVRAMRRADPHITLYACGAPVFWGKHWNDTLIAGAPDLLGTTTDHPLIGGNVPANVEPLDVFRDFMAVPNVLERRWNDLRQDMERAGVHRPRLAVTELQMFAHLAPATDKDAPVRLRPGNLVNPGTLAEALYDVLIYHAATRLAPFVEMVTHSATVNHGGGLRKERERVYPNPCHHAQAAFAAFADTVPVAIDLEAPAETAPLVLPELRNVTQEESFKTVDAVAALTSGGDLLLSLVHRAGAGATDLEVEFTGFRPGHSVEVLSLAAEVPWAANTLESPSVVAPKENRCEIREGRLSLHLEPYSVLRVRIPRAR